MLGGEFGDEGGEEVPAVAREAASCVSNASTKAISCSTLVMIRRCSGKSLILAQNLAV